MADSDDSAPVDGSISPAERRRNRVRGDILEAADEVFGREGEAGLSIRRLAEAIDYSPAAIYKYFGSKDDLLNELKNAFFERLLERMDELQALDRPFQERMRACVSGYVRTALENPRHYAGAFDGVTSVFEGASRHHASPASKFRAFDRLQAMISEGVSEGLLRSDQPPDILAKSAWAAMHGLAMLFAHLPHFPKFADDDNAPNQNEFIDIYADTIVNGLEK
ncbi:MAG: TetR/AcrR family transcriptional regulator [Pseudomonadota bacterium]